MCKEFELVVCIVNEGFAETVMDAARAQGAKGGTIIGARGTANPEAEKHFNITVEPHKEVVLIVARKEIADNVMKAVYDNMGLNTEGVGIAFALPVDETLGIVQ